MDAGYIEIAKSLMKEIQYDNGMINRIDGGEKYPTKWVNKIAPLAGKFFDAHPDLLSDDVIEDIACGEFNEVHSKYGHLQGYEELSNVLNEYFEAC